MKTLYEIIEIAVNNPENINYDGSINWNYVDADLWMHEDAVNYSKQEKYDALDNHINGDVVFQSRG